MYVKVAVKYLDHDPKSDSEKRSFASRPCTSSIACFLRFHSYLRELVTCVEHVSRPQSSHDEKSQRAILHFVERHPYTSVFLRTAPSAHRDAV